MSTPTAPHEACPGRSLPNVAPEPKRGVDRLIGFAPGAPLAAEGPRPRTDPARADREAQVASLPHRARVMQAGAGHEQPGAWIADPARLETLELLGQVEAELTAGGDRVDSFARDEQLVGQDFDGVALESLAKRLETIAPDGHARRRAVTSVALEVLGAGVQRGQQIEPRNAAGRARAFLSVEPDDDDRTVVALDHPRGDDPHHPGVPPLSGQDVGAPLPLLGHLRLRLPHDPLLHRSALGVDPVELFGDLGGALLVLGEEQFEAGVGPA